MESYNFSLLPCLNKQKVLALARGTFIPQHENVICVGQIGTGKTHLATAIGYAACELGYRVRFFTAAGLVNELVEAHRFAADLTPLEPLPFPPVEYRITDATPADADGRFWAINYFYPGDVQLKADSDPLLRLIVRNLPQVERLVEFRVTDEGVRFADSPPVYLELLADDARNWEGIARLDDRGFLLVTDYHPRTILAFVANP